MILLIDNYDSFSYNLYQLAGSLEPDIRVIRNDACTPEEIESMKPEALLLSPGPGRPEHAGVCIPAVRRFAGRIPILGVCLGHQAICEAFGGTVSYAKELMHGKQRLVYPEKESRLFRGISSPFPAARYHSLAADPDTLPKELRVTAWSEDGEVMAVEHTAYPVFGVQFHPESVMTPDGKAIMKNFMEAVKND
ncbi:aminodeoxychorismate/anthranilate synthase component II [Lachnoclostridium sp. An131]|uniref:anthranilate synthase component II n=1 Tax=Lachnoclostridium sp. An131 TaxID=1965555 RepID=UPI000B37D0C7|nr:aminodeoxychorismate/anthranilate synthase component II [Lachnoclostridium sp. An131]OUQ28066.1 aminodeoxychorismate/anthranilate synthase component II [Lachnoclostridium sp. An131]